MISLPPLKKIPKFVNVYDSGVLYHDCDSEQGQVSTKDTIIMLTYYNDTGYKSLRGELSSLTQVLRSHKGYICPILA